MHFEIESKCQEILNRGPWLFKDDWLAFSPFDHTLNVQDQIFNAMNVWVRIHDIPSTLLESDLMAIKTRSSLGSLIGIVTKTDTRRIDGNMTSYLRVGCCINVISPICRCVFIGGVSSSEKYCMLQYEHLPTLFYGCDLIGYLVIACPMGKLTPETKLQYGDWLRYLPPSSQTGSSSFQGHIHHHAANPLTPISS
ncbi:hypothetical protein V6N13_057103 [Hibiscus sabdariffa]